MPLAATGHHARPLTAERLCAWLASLFLDGRSELRRIQVGRGRSGERSSTQVVSGS